MQVSFINTRHIACHRTKNMDPTEREQIIQMKSDTICFMYSCTNCRVDKLVLARDVNNIFMLLLANTRTYCLGYL